MKIESMVRTYSCSTPRCTLRRDCQLSVTSSYWCWGTWYIVVQYCRLQLLLCAEVRIQLSSLVTCGAAVVVTTAAAAATTVPQDGRLGRCARSYATNGDPLLLCRSRRARPLGHPARARSPSRCPLAPLTFRICSSFRYLYSCCCTYGII